MSNTNKVINISKKNIVNWSYFKETVGNPIAPSPDPTNPNSENFESIGPQLGFIELQLVEIVGSKQQPIESKISIVNFSAPVELRYNSDTFVWTIKTKDKDEKLIIEITEK